MTYTVVNTPNMNIIGEGKIEQISHNPWDGGTWKSVGPSHKNGGIALDTNGDLKRDVEIEGNETVHNAQDGSTYIGGNLIVPGTKNKFNKVLKQIGEKEDEVHKTIMKANNLMEKNDPSGTFSQLSFNSGKAMSWSSDRQMKALAMEKDNLYQVQEAIHSVAQDLNIEPKDVVSKKFGGKIKVTVDSIPQAKYGYKTSNDAAFNALKNHPERYQYLDMAKAAAEANGFDVGGFQRLLFQESGFNPSAGSPAGARGIAQFMPNTYKGLGGDPRDLGSKDPAAIQRQLDLSAKHLASLQTKYKDPQLAFAAYNAGEGAIDGYYKTVNGKKTWKPGMRELITGRKDGQITGDDMMGWLAERRKTNPTNSQSAWQNQTYDYVNTIYKPNNTEFWSGNVKDGMNPETFRQNYYTPPEPPVKLNLPDFGPNGTPPSAPQYITEPKPVNIPVAQSQQAAQQIQMPNIVGKNKYSLADFNRPRIGNFLGEMGTLGDTADFVPKQQLNPMLYSPYQVSFQDRLNENNASFNAISAQAANNPEALSILAAQKYQADSSVLADQFRTNQGIENDVTNKNISLINATREKNLQLSDQQFVRQTQAKDNTKMNKLNAISSISDKLAKNRLENNTIRMAETQFSYRFNPTTGQLDNVNDPRYFAQTNAMMYNPNASITTKEMVDKDGRKSTTTTTSNRLNQKFRGRGRFAF